MVFKESLDKSPSDDKNFLKGIALPSCFRRQLRKEAEMCKTFFAQIKSILNSPWWEPTDTQNLSSQTLYKYDLWVKKT